MALNYCQSFPQHRSGSLEIHESSIFYMPQGRGVSALGYYLWSPPLSTVKGKSVLNESVSSLRNPSTSASTFSNGKNRSTVNGLIEGALDPQALIRLLESQAMSQFFPKASFSSLFSSVPVLCVLFICFPFFYSFFISRSFGRTFLAESWSKLFHILIGVILILSFKTQNLSLLFYPELKKKKK